MKYDFEKILKCVKEKRLIGPYLFPYVYSKKFKKYLREETFASYYKISRGETYNSIDEAKLLVAMTYIAITKYKDKELWKYVSAFYSTKLLERKKYIEVRCTLEEDRIRRVIDKYKFTDDRRQIDYIISNTIVPMENLKNFYDLMFDIYKYDFDFCLSNDLNKDLKMIFYSMRTIIKNQKLDNNGIELCVGNEKKTYYLNLGTINIIKKEYDFNQFIEFASNILKIIDSYYYKNPKIKISNPYLLFGYEEWSEHSRIHRKELKCKPYNDLHFESDYKGKNNCIYIPRIIIGKLNNKRKNEIRLIISSGDKVIYENSNINYKSGFLSTIILNKKIRLDKEYKKFKVRYLLNNKVIWESKKKMITK